MGSHLFKIYIYIIFLFVFVHGSSHIHHSTPQWSENYYQSHQSPQDEHYAYEEVSTPEYSHYYSEGNVQMSKGEGGNKSEQASGESMMGGSEGLGASEGSEASGEGSEVQDTTALKQEENPLNFLNLLGTDFQPGRLVNIFFGLIIMLFMMIIQGYAMWVFGIAYLPGTRALQDWKFNPDQFEALLGSVLDALEYWSKENPRNGTSLE